MKIGLSTSYGRGVSTFRSENDPDIEDDLSTPKTLESLWTDKHPARNKTGDHTSTHPIPQSEPDVKRYDIHIPRRYFKSESCAIYNGDLYVQPFTSRDQAIYKMDTETGQTVEKSQTIMPTLIDGVLYYYNGDSTVAEDYSTGDILWTNNEFDYNIASQGANTPARRLPGQVQDFDDRVMIYDSSTTVMHDKSDGGVVWNLDRAVGSFGRPQIPGTDLFMANSSSQVADPGGIDRALYSLEDGSLDDRVTFTDLEIGAISIGSDDIVVSGRHQTEFDDRVECYSFNLGRRWTVEEIENDPCRTMPIVNGNVFYLNKGNIEKRDLDTQEVVDELSYTDRIRDMETDGNIIMAFADNEIFAFEPSDMSIIWSNQIMSGLSEPVVSMTLMNGGFALSGWRYGTKFYEMS